MILHFPGSRLVAGSRLQLFIPRFPILLFPAGLELPATNSLNRKNGTVGTSENPEKVYFWFVFSSLAENGTRRGKSM